MSYREQQRNLQTKLIGNKEIFGDAKAGASYRGDDRDYILDDGLKNLYPKIAQKAYEYFKSNKIKWWSLEQGKDKDKIDKPSGHILSSQVACVNHLFPIRDDPDAVKRLLKNIDIEADNVCLVDYSDKPGTQGYISFEATCADDYLGEKNLTRGEYCTSLDAMIIAEKNKKKTLVLIEWKYTEYYSTGVSNDKSLGKSGEVRQNRYNKLIKISDYLKNLNTKIYYFEPFYQLMRQTLWGEQMVKKFYKDYDFIIVHVIPDKNTSLKKSGSYKYNINGSSGSLHYLWTGQLKEQQEKPVPYKMISPDVLLSNQSDDKWIKYLETRYWR